MLTRLLIRNFKLFDEVDLELGDRVVLIGPNNSGKSTALQAIALWDLGVKRWAEKRGTGEQHDRKGSVTVNLRDLIVVPVPEAGLLWRNLHVRQGETGRDNIPIEIVASGVDWRCGVAFDYANPESFDCRLSRDGSGNPMPLPLEATGVNVAYLPPMSGLAANETRLDRGALNVRLGEGRTAEVLRNLCFLILEDEKRNSSWSVFADRIERLFGAKLDPPRYVPERGEIAMTYRTHNGVRLDLSASGRGQQQTMLLLAHMTVNPGALLLLDEPDAHLEILRQRQIYDVLSETAKETGSQIIAASHSEVVLNEAAGKDILIAFVGSPHRVDNRGSQVLKALSEIGFEHYLQAERKGWILYLEGSTDLAILSAFARRLDHPAKGLLEAPYVHYIGNVPSRARAHYYGIREAIPGLAGLALFDRLDKTLNEDPDLVELMWTKREIENYVCHREALLLFAESEGPDVQGALFSESWQPTMQKCIDDLESALKALDKASPWGPDIKASDDFLDPLFKKFYSELGLENLTKKASYYRLADFVPLDDIDPEVVEKLDAIVDTATRAGNSRS